jgi:hypothetical protein
VSVEINVAVAFLPLILDFSDRHLLAAVSLEKRERFYLKYLQLDNHICSGGVGAAFPKAVAQSGQALWPFKSQIPGSNPGRSNTEPMTACRSIRKKDSILNSVGNALIYFSLPDKFGQGLIFEFWWYEY